MNQMNKLTWIIKRLDTLSGVLANTAGADSVKKTETNVVRNMVEQRKWSEFKLWCVSLMSEEEGVVCAVRKGSYRLQFLFPFFD